MMYRAGLRVLLATFLLIGVLVAWLALAESGLSTVLSLSQKLVPELTVKKVSGRLLDGAVFEQIAEEGSSEYANSAARAGCDAADQKHSGGVESLG